MHDRLTRAFAVRAAPAQHPQVHRQAHQHIDGREEHEAGE
jgi:hypothetical protein